MRKKAIVIGNKPEIFKTVDEVIFSKKKAKLIDSFDLVLRLNRCNNYYSTGIKTDLLFVSTSNPFFKLYKENEYIEILKNTKRIIVHELYFREDRKERFIKILEKANRLDLLENAILINIEKEIFKLDPRFVYREVCPYSNFQLLWWMKENYSKDYDIYFSNVDIEGRGKQISSWIPEIKAEAIAYEYFKKWLDEGSVKYLS